MADLTVNGRDLADYGVQVSAIQGWLDAPARRFEAVTLPGRMGAVVTDLGVSVEPRTLGVTVYAPAATVAARRTTLAALYRDLRGVVELSFGDDPSRFMYALLESGATSALGPALVVPEVETVLRFLVPDPVAYATIPSVLAIPAGGTRTQVPVGTAPHGGVLRLAGAGTNPCTLTLRDRSGVSLGTMTLATTWTSGEYVEVDLDAFTITKWNGATPTTILSALGSTETFFRFSPEDEPTLEVTGCGGATLTYRKADTV